MHTPPLNLTKEEVERDLADTNRDITCLINIVNNLKIFIEQPGEEDRSVFRADLSKYENLLNQAERLESRISAVLDSFP